MSEQLTTDPDEWPEGVEASEIAALVEDVAYMADHENDGPLPTQEN